MANFKKLKKGVSGVLAATTVSSSVGNIVNSVEFKNGFLGSRMSPGLAQEIEGSKNDIRSLKKSLNENKNDTDKKLSKQANDFSSKLGSLEKSFNERIDELSSEFNEKLNTDEEKIKFLTRLVGTPTDRGNTKGKVDWKWYDNIKTLVIYTDKGADRGQYTWDKYRPIVENVVIKKKVTRLKYLEAGNDKLEDGDIIGVFDAYEDFTNGILTSNLKKVTFEPNINLKTMDKFAFHGCYQLQSIKIPDSVTLIDRSAFEECTALTSVSVPNVKKISSYAFKYCDSLTSVSMPNVKIIYMLAFQGCSSLQTIEFGEIEEMEFDDPNNYPNNNYCGAFCGCNSLKTIIVANSSKEESIIKLLNSMRKCKGGCNEKLNLKNITVQTKDEKTKYTVNVNSSGNATSLNKITDK